MTREYLCIENGENFIVDASSLTEAGEAAAAYGGSVIGEILNSESND
jgi:hypothetical protein